MIPQEVLVRAGAEAAKDFTDHYYRCLNEERLVANLYVTNNSTYTQAGHPPADICINGLVVSTPEQWDEMVKSQRPVGPPEPPATRASLVQYHPDSLDCHVINSDYRYAAPPEVLVPNPSKPHQGASVRTMLLVTVSGRVTFGAAPELHFNDVFRLVPNWDAIAKHAKGSKRFLITSHTYRAF